MVIVTNRYLCVFEEYAFIADAIKRCTIDLIPFGAYLLLVLSLWAIVYKILDLFYNPKEMSKNIGESLRIIDFLDEFSQTIKGGYLDF